MASQWRTRAPARRFAGAIRRGDRDAVVLDAGMIRGHGPAVVEANEASGAGIYGCDPRDVLDVLRGATIARA
jgi:hypothetical protein